VDDWWSFVIISWQFLGGLWAIDRKSYRKLPGQNDWFQ
jgi:hypothetical protein